MNTDIVCKAASSVLTLMLLLIACSAVAFGALYLWLWIGVPDFPNWVWPLCLAGAAIFLPYLGVRLYRALFEHCLRVKQ